MDVAWRETTHSAFLESSGKSGKALDGGSSLLELFQLRFGAPILSFVPVGAAPLAYNFRALRSTGFAMPHSVQPRLPDGTGSRRHCPGRDRCATPACSRRQPYSAAASSPPVDGEGAGFPARGREGPAPQRVSDLRNAGATDKAFARTRLRLRRFPLPGDPPGDPAQTGECSHRNGLSVALATRLRTRLARPRSGRPRVTAGLTRSCQHDPCY